MQGTNEQVVRAVANWLAEGEYVWLATIVETWGASPRPAGSLFAFCPALNSVAGSLSGGCIEDDLLAELATAPMSASPELRLYGGNAAEQARLQLPCGGRLRIVLECLKGVESSGHFERLSQALHARQRVVRTLCLNTGNAQIAPSKQRLTVDIQDELLAVVLGAGERLLILGCGEVSAYLAELAQALDFSVTLCEPRQTHADRWRAEYPHSDLRHCLPDDLIEREFFDPYCAVVALSHDPRVDDMGLVAALQSPAFYVGAMGSARTSEKRKERLLALGLSREALSKLDAPIGVDIGSKTPPEIAVAVAAKLIQSRSRLLSTSVSVNTVCATSH